jgi:hypothetical protein
MTERAKTQPRATTQAHGSGKRKISLPLIAIADRDIFCAETQEGKYGSTRN